MIDWRELSFAVTLAVVLLGVATATAQDGQETSGVTCSQGYCRVPIEVMRSLVQRADLCGWEVK